MSSNTANFPDHYRPEIDGIRAIAVLSVILFHLHSPVVPGGFVGVDVFFVISGFLITGIILSGIEKGHFDIAEFYARRAKRILPMLLLVMIICVPFAWNLLTQSQLENFIKTWIATTLFASNFYLASSAGYFDTLAEENPLTHTWSLAVEEQYYLIFPIIILLTSRKGIRTTLIILSLISIISIILSEIGTYFFQNFNFFFTFSRFWEIMIGSLAVIISKNTNKFKQIYNNPLMLQYLSIGGILGIIIPIVGFNAAIPTPSFWLLIPTLGTALVLCFATQKTLIGKFLSMKIPSMIGLMSYSAYLWHQPIIVFFKNFENQFSKNTMQLLTLALIFSLAYFSQKFVEDPIRQLKMKNNQFILIFSTLILLFLAGSGKIGLALAETNPRIVPKTISLAFLPPARSKECFDIPNGHSRPDNWHCQINFKDGRNPNYMLFGDSHGLQILGAFEIASQMSNTTGIFAGFSGCAPFLDIYPLTRPDQGLQNCNALNSRVFEYIKANNIKNVFLAAKWSYYTNFWAETRYINAIGLSPTEQASLPNSRRAFAWGMKRTLDAYRQIGVRVHVIEQVPQQMTDPATLYEQVFKLPGITAQGKNEALRSASVSKGSHLTLQSFPSAVFRLMPELDILNFDDVFCDTQVCSIGNEHSSYYQDRSHLSGDGAQKLVPRLSEVLKRIQ